MNDEFIDPTIGMVFPVDHSPNYTLFMQEQAFWDSISEEQHMQDHEIMIKNIEELAREDLKLRLSSKALKT